jgi:hypothetical protein
MGPKNKIINNNILKKRGTKPFLLFFAIYIYHNIKMPRVYVAGAFHDYVAVRKAQEYMKTLGFEITYDWTILAEKKVLSGVVMDEPEKMISDAVLDMNGVFDADWTLALINDPKYVYRGTFCELGASLMRDRLRGTRGQTIILCPKDEELYAKTLCFFHHPDIKRVNNLDELGGNLLLR